MKMLTPVAGQQFILQHSGNSYASGEDRIIDAAPEDVGVLEAHGCVVCEEHPPAPPTMSTSSEVPEDDR